MRRSIFIVLALAAAAGLAGCRTPGDSGYVELDRKEYLRLESFARGILVKGRGAARRDPRATHPPANTAAVAGYIMRTAPNFKADYNGDLRGKVIFEWRFDEWAYRAEAAGDLAGAPEKLTWSLVQHRPPRVWVDEGQSGSVELWTEPDPTVVDMYLRETSGDTLLYDTGRDENIIIEGAEVMSDSDR